MKCNKCYCEIKEEEEIGGSWYCQICHKSERRKGDIHYGLSCTFYTVMTLSFLFVIYCFWKQSRSPKKKPKDDK